MGTKAFDEYLNQVDIKSITASLKKGLKSKEVIREARDILFQAEFAKQAIATGNTTFEEVKEVGYYPQERRLEAVLDIKRQFGYGGGLGSIGSYEYVGLYVNWNGDGDFNDTGEECGLANVHVFDPGVANANTLPISYTIAELTDVAPIPTLAPGTVVKVRAILSWQVPPTGPDFVPIYGNRIDRWIRIDPVE